MASNKGGWTAQRRDAQSKAIRRWKPWEYSTGPRTPKGKAKSAKNRYRGAIRATLRTLARALREQRQLIEDYVDRYGQ